MAKSSNVMTSLLHSVEDLFRSAITTSYPSLATPPVMVTASTNDKFGDYQCNSAMGIAGVSVDSFKGKYIFGLMSVTISVT